MIVKKLHLEYYISDQYVTSIEPDFDTYGRMQENRGTYIRTTDGTRHYTSLPYTKVLHNYLNRVRPYFNAYKTKTSHSVCARMGRYAP